MDEARLQQARELIRHYSNISDALGALENFKTALTNINLASDEIVHLLATDIEAMGGKHKGQI